MLVSLLLFGGTKDGYIPTTPVAGFSGIAGIIWDVGMMMTNDKLDDGMVWRDTQCKLLRIAGLVTAIADQNNDKHYCTGRMTQEIFSF
tara:strand:- start:78219 stop:78482 length:264 start_codon:yes stop_codon:yes gene_type:complete